MLPFILCIEVHKIKRKKQKSVGITNLGIHLFSSQDKSIWGFKILIIFSFVFFFSFDKSHNCILFCFWIVSASGESVKRSIQEVTNPSAGPGKKMKIEENLKGGDVITEKVDISEHFVRDGGYREEFLKILGNNESEPQVQKIYQIKFLIFGQEETNKITMEIITVPVYFNTPSNSKQKNFSDGFRWFEFEWGILRAELQIQFYLLKSRKPKRNLIFPKHFQAGLCVLSSRGIKVDEKVMVLKLEKSCCKKILFFLLILSQICQTQSIYFVIIDSQNINQIFISFCLIFPTKKLLCFYY